MATIILQVEDESLVAKVKQACKMLMGVTSVKVQKTSQRVDDITKTAHYKAAMDDVKNGRYSLPRNSPRTPRTRDFIRRDCRSAAPAESVLWQYSDGGQTRYDSKH